MKFLITGGNRGLGLALCERFDGDSISRQNGYDISKLTDQQRIAELSLQYDVFVNNAFDGPFQESWANFGQTHLLWAVANLWQENHKTGTIINIGSVGTETAAAPVQSFETYRVAKTALKSHSLQWTRAFKENQVQFRTSLLTLDRLDTPLSRSRPTWTGNGISLSEVGDYVQLLTQSQPNTCIQEITAWVNFDHKHS
jgi:NAD(P)-dependent dehydrogenase (short-subunit alcohol dehydrogenase family)